MLEDGTSAEMNFDEGVIRAYGKHSEFSDVSFKLLFGQPSGLENFVLALEEKYDLVRGLSGKYERTLRLIRSRA
jgi:inorganic triphosphatase YgiF